MSIIHAHRIAFQGGKVCVPRPNRILLVTRSGHGGQKGLQVQVQGLETMLKL